MRRLVLCCLLLASTAHAELFPFAMPWDDASANITNISSWNSQPAGKNGFVHVDNGHLYTGNERIRFLGMNIVFGATCPNHEEADKVAARLARFGINAVRFHHMDARPAPDGLLQKDLKTLDPVQLDRFDYFVAALKREGIYSDINLHVSRKYPGMADWGEDTPKYWKGVDHFFPAMLAMQKDYARDLLTHRNPYTQLRYVEDPAVAFIEINNENGLIREWQRGNLDGMTEPYNSEFKRRWLAWLKKRYPNTAALRNAWGVKDKDKGPNLLNDNRINVRSSDAGWNLQLMGGAQATLSEEDSGAARLDLQKAGGESFHTQLHQNRLNLKAEEPYTLGLRLRADRPMKVTASLMQAHTPWQRLWSQDVLVNEDWHNWRPTFALPHGEENARLTLTGLGLQTGTLWLGGISLQAGGTLGLKPGETLESNTIDWPTSNEFLNLTTAGQRDWLTFLWETEANYWLGMQVFIRDELGAKAPIIGTQVSYSPAAIQGQLDVVDGHAYWQHPRFPGKPWDQDNWLISNSPMAGTANGGTLPDLALRRVPGKPFIVTEYNHSAPSQYQGEALPLITAWGAMQDWDGIFIYSYGTHSKTWDPGYINNFFDSQANPIKMASLLGAAALLRRGDVTGLAVPVAAEPDTKSWIEALRVSGKLVGADAFGAPRSAVLTAPVNLSTHADPTMHTGELVWSKTATINTAKSKAVIGYKAGLVTLSDVGFELLQANNDWGVLQATVIEGQNFSSPGKILLTALGQVENTSQKWLDSKKSSLGRNWGNAPTLIEGLSARLTLPVAPSQVEAWALDERGNRKKSLPITGSDRAHIEIGPDYQTLWYEIEIHPKGFNSLVRALW